MEALRQWVFYFAHFQKISNFCPYNGIIKHDEDIIFLRCGDKKKKTSFPYPYPDPYPDKIMRKLAK